MNITDLRYYNGLPSVTSVIKHCLPEPDFMSMWRARAAAAENREEEEQKIKDTLENACMRGSYVHRFLEEWKKGELNFYHEDPRVLAFVNGAINFLNMYGKDLDPLVIDGKNMIEVPLVGKRYAGTPDLPAYHKGKLTVVDYKTASTPKLNEEMLHRYKLQQGGLYGLYKELYPEYPIEQSYIQILTDKRKSGVGEQYIILQDELEELLMEFNIYLDRMDRELDSVDRDSLVNYLAEDPIMAMDRKL